MACTCYYVVIFIMFYTCLILLLFPRICYATCHAQGVVLMVLHRFRASKMGGSDSDRLYQATTIWFGNQGFPGCQHNSAYNYIHICEFMLGILGESSVNVSDVMSIEGGVPSLWLYIIWYWIFFSVWLLESPGLFGITGSGLLIL